MTLKPPPLENSCFALPAGVNWLSCNAALERLDAALRPVVSTNIRGLDGLLGAILAQDVHALRAHPPAANSAVDGYALRAADIQSGENIVPLAQGRSAAGEPNDHDLPPGMALRILTGALLPRNADCVVLQEDVAREGGKIALNGPVKSGANSRSAAEDITQGEILLSQCHRLRPADLALLAAAGCDRAAVYTPLRVGILATGDEIFKPGHARENHQVNDANSNMLVALAQTWGYKTQFFGIIKDDRSALRAALDRARREVDVLITTGGASAGDEDHVSALLQDEGHVTAWRIAVKPGRPLILGQWDNMPMFGLPGNPVAAFVCMLIFLRPALRRLAGALPQTPQGFQIPANFIKNKKAGRQEFLRARIRDGKAEVYPSEGSGRVKSISWAQGLVVLDEEARTISQGDLVTYIPFNDFD